MNAFRSITAVGLLVAGIALAGCTPNVSEPAGGASPASTSASQASTAGACAAIVKAGGSSAPQGEDAGFGPIDGKPETVKVGMAYAGPKGDRSFTDSAVRGLGKATAKGVQLVGEASSNHGEPESAKVDRLQQLIDQGANTVIAVNFDYAGAVKTVAAANPTVNFAIVDAVVDGPNVASLTFASNEASFLVGAAAAMTSKSHAVGFVGGVNVPLIQNFQSGFDAGARCVDDTMKITDQYITEAGDMTGFRSPDKAQTIAKGMFDSGADIVYPAAGSSSVGVLKAAKDAGKQAIGVDSDQAQDPTLSDYSSLIITSAMKNVDVAVYAYLASVATGSPEHGIQVFDLKNGGVGYSTTGGHLDSIVGPLEAIRSAVIDGTLTVPSVN